MKLIKYLFLILVFASAGYAQNVKITDFKIPVSTAKQFLVGGNWNWAQTGDSVTTNQFNVNADYNQFYTSLPYSWDLTINGNLQQKYADSLDARYNFVGNINKYFSNNGASFFYVGATSSYLRQIEFGIEDRPQIAVTTGLGYGRLVNATAMAKAVRIDQDLKKYGVTTAYMSRETMQAIATIIDKESEYKNTYKSVYEYKIVGDILKEVQNSGVAGEFVNSSLSYFRVREVIFGVNQFINPRYYGGDIRLGVGYTLLSRNDSIANNGFMNVQGRYSYPLDLQQQINLIAGVRTPFDSLYGKLYEGTGGVSYSYNFTNRISFIAGYTINLLQQINDQVVDTSGAILTRGTFEDYSVANHLFNAGFNFYLENYITLSINAGLSKEHARKSDYFTNVGAIFTVF